MPRGITRITTMLAFALALPACDREDDSPPAAAPAAEQAQAPAPAGDRDDRVEDAIDADSVLGMAGIDVDDRFAHLVLKGVVATQADRERAAEIAARTEPGYRIDNRIVVDQAALRRMRADDLDDVEERAEDALEADASLAGLDLDVGEEGGTLVLEGTVKTDAQRTTAEAIAKRAAGTVAIVNRIKVEN